MKIKNAPAEAAPKEVATKMKIGKRRYTIHVRSKDGVITHFAYRDHVFPVVKKDVLGALKKLEGILKKQEK